MSHPLSDDYAMKNKITITLSPELWNAAALLARDKKQTAAALVTSLLASWVGSAADGRARRTRRFGLRVTGD